MNFGEMKAQLIEEMGRSDISDSRAGNYILNGLVRTQRRLRLPCMEKTVIISGATSDFLVPGDYLDAISVIDEANNIELKRTDIRNLLRIPKSGNGPKSWCRQGSLIMLRPYASGDIILSYYSTTGEPSVDSDETILMRIIPDVIMSAALIEACTTYMDDRLPIFESRFENLATEVQIQSDEEALRNSSIGNPYADAEY